MSYDVYRDDRVIASVFGTTFVDDQAGAGTHRYTVRAADARGNRSASPAPLSVNGPTPSVGDPITWGATWRYVDSGADLGTAWKDPATADSSWTTGKARLGWGGTQVTTVGGARRPITTYYRNSFSVPDPSAVKVAAIDLKVSQGAVVYLNGVEIGRYNMPDGAITSTTVASRWVGGTANDVVRTFLAPSTLLRAGTNVLAVEVHGWRDQSGVTVLDGAVRLLGASAADTAPPSTPVATVSTQADGFQVSWTASTDDVGLGGYLVSRDSTPLRVLPPGATGFRDLGPTGSPRTYVVTAFDTAGNLAPSAPVTSAVGASELLAFGSTWRWSYPEAAAAPSGTGWTTEAFDDTSWATGAGSFGFGVDNPTTVISTAPAPRPLTSYYRTKLNVADPSQYATLSFDLVRNAGAVVYVNGVEVARSNMPDGIVGPNTYSGAAPSAAQRTVPVRINVPPSAFKAGTNTIAVEVHLGWRSQPTSGFDLKITGAPR